MKKLLITILLFSLMGCSTLSELGFDTYNVTKFDPIEYSLSTKIREVAILSAPKCADKIIMLSLSEEINTKVLQTLLYSQGIPNNSEISDMLQKLHGITSEFSRRYVGVQIVNEAYCDDKMKIIMRSAATIQQAIGAKSK